MNDKKFLLSEIILVAKITCVSALIAWGIIGFVSTKTEDSAKHPIIEPNIDIVYYMTSYFNEEDTLSKIVAKALQGIRYYAPSMEYVVYSTSEGRKHYLDSPYGCLNDTFPCIVIEMKSIFPKKWNEPYRVLFREGSIIFLPHKCLYGVNNNEETPYFAFCTKSDKELQEDYKNYKLYDTTDTVSNDYNGGWLKRIEENWYIVSPDSLGNDYYY